MCDQRELEVCRISMDTLQFFEDIVHIYSYLYTLHASVHGEVSSPFLDMILPAYASLLSSNHWLWEKTTCRFFQQNCLLFLQLDLVVVVHLAFAVFYLSLLARVFLGCSAPFDLLHMVYWCLCCFLRFCEWTLPFLWCCSCRGVSVDCLLASSSWLCFAGFICLLCTFYWRLPLGCLESFAPLISDISAFVAFWLAVGSWYVYCWDTLVLLCRVLAVLKLRSRGGLLWFSGVVDLSLLVVRSCCRRRCFACSPLSREFVVVERAGWVFLLEVSR